MYKFKVIDVSGSSYQQIERELNKLGLDDWSLASAFVGPGFSALILQQEVREDRREDVR